MTLLKLNMSRLKFSTLCCLSLLLAFLLSNNAMAMVAEVAGETSCMTVSVSQKKLLKQLPCRFEGNTGASMVYFVQQLSFYTTNEKTISTVNNASFRFGEGGEMLDLEETILINDKPAEVIRIDSKTFKKLSDAEFDNYHKQQQPDFSKVLHCFKPFKQDNAFCIPYGIIYGMA